METEILQNDVKELCRKIYPYGDNFYAKYFKNSQSWELSYTNDKPMQHGDGEKCILPEKIVLILIDAYASITFDSCCRSAIKYLCENHHPHVTLIITPTGAELLEGIKSTGQILQYVKD